MSQLLQRLNTIKSLCIPDWMTPSQRRTWDILQSRLELGDIVNLHGQAGCGKTFLAWLFVKIQRAIYAPAQDAIPHTTGKPSLLIIDNQQPARDAYRALLSHLSTQQRQQTVIISRIAIHDDCYKVALHFTPEDRLCVQQRVVTLAPDLLVRTGGTLHHLINPDLPLDTEEPPL